jgi:hypothetical protein
MARFVPMDVKPGDLCVYTPENGPRELVQVLSSCPDDTQGDSLVSVCSFSTKEGKLVPVSRLIFVSRERQDRG